MGTSRHRTPSGARLNLGPHGAPHRNDCGKPKNRQNEKMFKGVCKNFLRVAVALVN
jgi:hypothetical protein